MVFEGLVVVDVAFWAFEICLTVPDGCATPWGTEFLVSEVDEDDKDFDVDDDDNVVEDDVDDELSRVFEVVEEVLSVLLVVSSPL